MTRELLIEAEAVLFDVLFHGVSDKALTERVIQCRSAIWAEINKPRGIRPSIAENPIQDKYRDRRSADREPTDEELRAMDQRVKAAIDEARRETAEWSQRMDERDELWASRVPRIALQPVSYQGEEDNTGPILFMACVIALVIMVACILFMPGWVNH